MLSKCDTEEYREREAMASRMAHEIEKSPSFQHHANLENGDGDDEELQFSAVVRTNDSNSTADGGSNSGYLFLKEITVDACITTFICIKFVVICIIIFSFISTYYF